MANENCLAGMRCPKCQSEEPLRIEVKTLVMMYDEGSDDDKMGGDQEWNGDSYCECWACHYAGTVHDFRIAPEEAHDAI